MGMSTSVIGFISSDDETYQKHAKVLQACIDADIEELPKETSDYFDNLYPEKHLFEEKLEVEIPITEYNDNESQSGYELLVSEIPEGVHKIRFVNSW